MKLSKDEIKAKILVMQGSLSDAHIRLSGNYVYLSSFSETGLYFNGYRGVDGWGVINITWEELSDENYEILEKFVLLKYPKEYTVTRESYLINFKNEDSGETMTVNLKDKNFIKTNAKGSKRVIKYPNTFFKGMDGRIVASKIPAEDTFKKLVDVIIRKYSGCSNFGTFLVRLFNNIHLETYISAGVRFSSYIMVGYDFFDKDVRNTLNKHNINYDQTVERFFANNHDLGKSMLHFIKDEKDFESVFRAIAQNMRDITNLVDNYKYDIKRLFEYCKERDWASGRGQYYYKDLVSFMNDYARMAELVFPNGFDKYPKDIIDHHDGVTKLYEKEKIKFDDAVYSKLIDEKMEYSNKEYAMIFPKSTGDIQSEGRILCHCVGSYVGNIISGYTTILFLREKTDLTTPLVTVEVRDGRIAQSRGKFNRSLSYQEKLFLTEYAEKKKLRYG